ncbi:hypothetical protein [Pedobacter sp. KBS0701]|uniref:hypothetical protein n=1 Tax=Pedobacter sp. KBS0701 TaxID=2578106 RepID=UPI001AEFCF54|nr:hypothetical protein [Pedobacter sp. KBS0701]
MKKLQNYVYFFTRTRCFITPKPVLLENEKINLIQCCKTSNLALSSPMQSTTQRSFLLLSMCCTFVLTVCFPAYAFAAEALAWFAVAHG